MTHISAKTNKNRSTLVIIVKNIALAFVEKKEGFHLCLKDEIPLYILLPSICCATQAASPINVTVAELVEAGTLY